MTAEFGLPERTLDEMRAIFAQHSKVKKVLVYGSRATGKHKAGSDIDLTLFGSALEYADLLRIAGELDDSSIPYLVDLSIFDQIDHVKLKDHIKRCGKIFYDRYAEWQTVKLGDVCDVLDKLRKPITKKDRISGNYPYYGATGIVDWVHDYIFDEKLVLIGEDGAKWSAGDATAFIATGKYWVNNHAHVLRPKPQLVLHEWISYYLTGVDLSEFVTGLTVPKLNQAQLKLIPIPLPPLAEQQRIVAKLDAAFSEIDKGIALAEVRSVQVENLKKTVAVDAFKESKSWVMTTLGEYYDVRDGTHDSPKYVESGFPFVTSKNLKSGKLDLSNVKYIAQQDYESINKRSKVDVGDILMAMIGTIGNPILITDEPFYAIKNVALFKTNSAQSPKFLQYFLNLPDTINKMIADAKGTTQKFVGLGYLRAFPLSVPPLAEQQRIVAKLDAAFAKIDIAKTAILQSKANYQALKSAILTEELQQNEAP